MLYKLCFKTVSVKSASQSNNGGGASHTPCGLQGAQKITHLPALFTTTANPFSLQIDAKLLLTVSALPTKVSNLYINDSKALVLSSLVRLSAMLPTRSVRFFKTTGRTLRRFKIPASTSKLIRISSFFIQLVQESLQFVKLFQ